MTQVLSKETRQPPEAFFDDTEGLRFLILDDSEFDRRRLSRETARLSMPVHICEADSISTFQSKLEETVYDVILLDYNLPQGNGIEALGLVKNHPKNSKAATIMIADDADARVAVEAMKKGCNDYISKIALLPEDLRYSIWSALKNSAITPSNVTASELDAARFEILEDMSKSCFQQIQPILMKMLRQIRTDRNNCTTRSKDQSVFHDTLEADCMSLWEYLNDIETVKEAWKPSDIHGYCWAGHTHRNQ